MTVRLTGTDSNSGDLFQESKLIVVEGSTDQKLLVAVIQHLQLDGFQVHEVGGKTNWSKKIRAISLDDSFRDNVARFGLVRDADESGRSALQSCLSALRNAGLAPPGGRNDANETIPQTFAHIIPAVDSVGAIEELLLPALDPGRMECVDQYFDSLELRRISTKISGKSRIRVYLAGLPVDVRDATIAIAKNYIDFSGPVFSDIRLFIQEMES